MQVYSYALGRMAFLVYGNKYHVQPLDEVELTYDYQPMRSMQTLKSLSLTHVPVNGDMSRHCVRLFVAEVLSSIFCHEMQDEAVFSFLQDTVRDIDLSDDPENAHLRFLVGISQLMGIGSPEAYVPTTREQRQHTLRTLLAHLVEHVEGFQIPRSLDILTEVFD